MIETFQRDDLRALELGEGIHSDRAAAAWMEECNTLRSERAKVDWARIGAGRLPRGGAGFSSYDDLINEATTNGKSYDFDFSKTAAQAAVATIMWNSLWNATGNPGAGAAPAATPGAVGDNLTGSMNMANQSPDFKHVLSFGAVSNQNMVLCLYDRLWGVGALATGTTGTKTVSTGTLSRYATTASTVVGAWLEYTTASTAAGAVNLLSYTASDASTGNAGPSLTIPAAVMPIMAMVKLPETAGKIGVTAVSTINVGTAMTTSVTSLVLLRQLAYIPLIANVWNERDLVLQLAGLGATRVFDAASLALMYLNSGANTPTVWGKVRLAYG